MDARQQIESVKCDALRMLKLIAEREGTDEAFNVYSPDNLGVYSAVGDEVCNGHSGICGGDPFHDY